MSLKRCPLCGGDKLIEDERLGEVICVGCGAVVDELVYRGPEWRAYGLGDRLRRERVGAPITPLLHDLGLSTGSLANQDLRSWEERVMISSLSEIHRLSSSMRLPRSVAETASVLLRKLKPDLKRFRGCFNLLPASLLHLSLRIHGVPRSPKELAQHVGVSSSKVLRCSMRIANLLDVKAQPDVKACIAKLTGALGLPGRIEEHANKICAVAIERGLSQGRDRRALAAASVYLAARSSGHRLSQRRIAKVGQVGLSTLRRRLKELIELLQSDEHIRRGWD